MGAFGSIPNTTERGTRVSYFHQIHTVTMDDRGRLFMPSAFRHDAPPEVLAGDFHISPEKDQDRGGYLVVRPHGEWQGHLKAIEASPLPRKAIKEYLKIQNALSQKTTLDRQNRLVLSPQMRDMLGLDADSGKVDVVLVGGGRFFEIWLAERFEGVDTMVDRSAELRELFESIQDNPGE